MSAPQTNYVHQGSYIDYGRDGMNKHQWLWPTYRAGIWTNFLGILVTIAVARLVKILWRMDILAADYAALCRPPPQGNAPKHILFTLEDDDKEPTLEGLGWQMMLTFYNRLRPGVHRLPGASRFHNVRGRDMALLFVGGAVLLGSYIGVLIFGIITSFLATDTTALSASPECGVYLPTSNYQNHSYDINHITRPYEFDTQLASANWAKLCYHADTGADGCNFFLQQSIEYDTIHNASCPFEGEMCHGGNTAAIKFSTPPVSSRALGVNSPKTYEFQRNTTCSPLVMNETFIQLYRDGNEYTFSYQYGPAEDIAGGEDWTWRTDSYGSNFGQAPAYIVGTLTTSNSTEPAKVWDPIPELRPPKGASVTIIFVLPKKIYYISPSTDPIFPANHQRFLPDDDTPYWLYTRGHATVMACLDQTSWRDPDQGPMWHNVLTEIPPPPAPDPRVRGGLLLFWFSIMNSNTYQAISQRLGHGLNASDRLSGFTSLPLATEQWKVEATRIFETSLARTQIDARNIARGVMANYPGYVKSKNDAPEMCQDTYLFISEGWTNVNKFWSLIVLIPCVLIAVLAITTDTEETLMERLLCGYAVPLSVFVIWTIVRLGDIIGWLLNVQTWATAYHFLKWFCNVLTAGISQIAKLGINMGMRLWRFITCL